MRRQIIFRLFESILAEITLHLLVRAQRSYDKSLPFNVYVGKNIEVASKWALFVSWALPAIDAAESCKSVGKMLWDGRKGCGRYYRSFVANRLNVRSQFGTLKLAEQTHVPLPRRIPNSGTVLPDSKAYLC